MEYNSIDWSRCVGVSIDGGAAMTSKHNGVVAFIKTEIPPKCRQHTHCMLHREILVARRIDDELHQVLQVAVKIVNYVKAHLLKHRFLKPFAKK